MVQTVIFGYIGIGAALTALLFLSAEVRRDAATWEPFDLASFLLWQVVTWPETAYAVLFSAE